MKKQPAKLHLPLDTKESSRLYWELAKRGAYCNGEKYTWKYAHLTEEEFFTMAFLQARHDPRLLSILIDLFSRQEIILHPIHFKNLLKNHEALTISALIGEFILEQKPSDLFQFLMSCAKPVPTQLFYKNLYRLGGHKMQETIQKPLWYFKKWGFLASDSPLLKERKEKKRIYLYDGTSRLSILKNFSKEKKYFQLKDYLQKIGASVSRQQALKDLHSVSWIKKKGRGKGTTYSYCH